MKKKSTIRMMAAAAILACHGMVRAQSPYEGQVFITGIMDAQPSDESNTDYRDHAYRAVEFFSYVGILDTELPNFSLRIIPDSLTANPTVEVALAAVSVRDHSPFFAVAHTPSFLNLYNTTEWQSRFGGNPANIVYEASYGGAPVTGLSAVSLLNGNDVIQLVHRPGGLGSGVVLDTFGQVDYAGAPGGLPVVFDPGGAGLYVWGYEDSWAYRLDGTIGSGGAFAPGDWNLQGPSQIADLTFAQTASAVGFMTFSAIVVPEAGTASLLALGLFAVRVLRRRIRA